MEHGDVDLHANYLCVLGAYLCVRVRAERFIRHVLSD
jgi:hypothetical protein